MYKVIDKNIDEAIIGQQPQKIDFTDSVIKELNREPAHRNGVFKTALITVILLTLTSIMVYASVSIIFNNNGSVSLRDESGETEWIHYKAGTLNEIRLNENQANQAKVHLNAFLESKKEAENDIVFGGYRYGEGDSIVYSKADHSIKYAKEAQFIEATEHISYIDLVYSIIPDGRIYRKGTVYRYNDAVESKYQKLKSDMKKNSQLGEIQYKRMKAEDVGIVTMFYQYKTNTGRVPLWVIVGKGNGASTNNFVHEHYKDVMLDDGTHALIEHLANNTYSITAMYYGNMIEILSHEAVMTVDEALSMIQMIGKDIIENGNRYEIKSDN